MEWSKNKSIMFSKVCIALFAIAGVVTAVIAPMYSDWALLVSFYTLLIPAYVALYQLFKLLNNIGHEEIFTKANVYCLRMLSWACYVAAWVCLISATYYSPFIILAAGAGFMGLILRIVKNVFAAAVDIKQENDATI